MTGQQLDWLKQDLVRLESKVDSLIKFKWQVLGISAFLGLIIQIVIAVAVK